MHKASIASGGEGASFLARWRKKTLVFSVAQTDHQLTLIDQLRRRLKIDFHVRADSRGVLVTLHGDPEQIRLALKRAKAVYRSLKEEARPGAP